MRCRFMVRNVDIYVTLELFDDFHFLVSVSSSGR